MAKYKKEFVDKLPSLMANGESVAEVCGVLNITRETFYQWVKNKPDFAEAYQRGRLLSEAWWQKLGRAGALGQKPVNPTIWIFNMKNRFGWADKKEIKQETTVTGFEVVEDEGTGESQ